MMRHLINRNRKAFTFANAVILYLLILCLISAIKHPKIMTDEQLLAGASDFVPLSGIVKFSGDKIVMSGEGANIIAAEVQLDDAVDYKVSFEVECPQQNGGVTIYVDLFNGESSYDSNDSQFSAVLSPGSNDFEGLLKPGSVHPSTALLRIFTDQTANLTLNKVMVEQLTYTKELNSSISLLVVLIAVFGVTQLLLAVTGRGEKGSRQ